jgi:hypothetical protein
MRDRATARALTSILVQGIERLGEFLRRSSSWAAPSALMAYRRGDHSPRTAAPTWSPSPIVRPAGRRPTRVTPRTGSPAGSSGPRVRPDRPIEVSDRSVTEGTGGQLPALDGLAGPPAGGYRVGMQCVRPPGWPPSECALPVPPCRGPGGDLGRQVARRWGFEAPDYSARRKGST